MPKGLVSSDIINRNAPILVINETDENFEVDIRTELRRKGLVSKICRIESLPSNRVSSRYAVVVSIIDTDTDIPFIADIEPRSGAPLEKIAIDLAQENNGQRLSVAGLHVIKGKNDAKNISSIISDFFRSNIDLDLFDNRKANDDYGPKLKDLIQRLEIATDSISDLRLNSTSEAIAELKDVVSNLKLKFAHTTEPKITSKDDLRQVIYEVLYVIAKIYDHIDNSRLAAIVVSGVTTAIMGCSGLSATLNVAIMLASWHGKDAFLLAIGKINSTKSAISQSD